MVDGASGVGISLNGSFNEEKRRDCFNVSSETFRREFVFLIR